MTISIHPHWKLKYSYLLLLIGLLITSCGEIYDLNQTDWEPDVPPSDSVYNREIQILDLGDNNVPPGHKPVDISDPLYFSLEKFSSVHIGYKSSARWDVAFHGMYRTTITANSGTSQGLGYGSSAIGGMVVLDTPYTKLTHIPDNVVFQTPGQSGLGFAEVFAGYIPGGHVYYTFFDSLYHPGQDHVNYPENLYLHMMYPLSEDFASKFPGASAQGRGPKTILIRTASGNYVKMETQSFYKGVTDPIKMRRGTDNPIPYVTFKYMVIKADEARFGFVERNKKLTINLSTKKTTVGP